MAKKKSIPGDEAAARLVSLYRDAEKSIADRITKTMAQTDDKNRLKIRSLEQQQKAIKKVLKQLLSGTRAPVEEMIGDSFNGGLAVARKELKEAGLEDVVMEMNGINARAMKIYSDQVYSRMADVVQTSLRTVTDIYGALKLDSSLGGAVGGYDAIGNVRRNLNKISEAKGITAFIDKSGRSWNMETYCEMLTRTATMQVFHQGKTNEYLAHGEDLVKVTTHEPTCEKCAPWGGKVLSLTGQTPGYPTLEEAKAAGLFHPSCRHTYALYIAEEQEENPEPKIEKYLPLESYRDDANLLKTLFSSDNVEIADKKLTHYALDKTSSRGKDKAEVFEDALGFTQKDADELKSKILGALENSEINYQKSDNFGDRYTIIVNILGKNGVTKKVKTGWIFSGKSKPHLTTLMVAKPGEQNGNKRK